MAVDNNYNTIKSRICSINCTEQELQSVKLRYAARINSRRRLDSIRTVSDLVRILEKRDCLSPTNIDVLMEIAVELRAPYPILNLFARYHNNANRVNNQRVEADDQENLRVLPQIPSDPKRRAYQLIATEIGQKWQDFARALSVSEGYIDNLSNECKTIAPRVYEILRFHEQSCDRRVWLTTILDALSEARRNDLRSQVQHIFDTS